MNPPACAQDAAPPLALRSLPPLPRAGAGADDLMPAQRRLLVGGIALVHLAALWGLMQIGAVREAVLQAAPMFVNLMAAPAPPAPPVPPQPPKPQTALARPAPQPVMAAAPSPAPAAFTVPAPLPEASLEPAATAPVVTASAPAAAATLAPAPRILPASAVQYLEAPVVEYPSLAKRNGETGLVVVRASVDASGGTPRAVLIGQSSGHPRLDEAALAAVRKARFKPYTENGRPVDGWALIPIHFELEK